MTERGHNESGSGTPQPGHKEPVGGTAKDGYLGDLEAIREALTEVVGLPPPSPEVREEILVALGYALNAMDRVARDAYPPEESPLQ